MVAKRAGRRADQSARGGVKGGKWFRLIDKVDSEACLHSAARQVLGNQGKPGVDHVSVEDFAARMMPEIRKLSEALRAGAYRAQAIRRVQIPKPGSNETRPLGPVAQQCLSQPARPPDGRASH